MQDFANLDGTALLREGLTAAAAGNRELAKKLFLQVTAEYPSEALAWICLAEISENLSGRIANLRTAAAKNPANARPRVMLTAARKQLSARLLDVVSRKSESTGVLPVLLAASNFDPANESVASALLQAAVDIVSSQPNSLADTGKEALQAAFSSTTLSSHGIELSQADEDGTITINAEDLPLPSSAIQLVTVSSKIDDFLQCDAGEIVIDERRDQVAKPELSPPSERGEQQQSATAHTRKTKPSGRHSFILSDTLARSGDCSFCMQPLKEEDGRCVTCGGTATIRDPRLDDTFSKVDPRLMLVAVNRLTLVVKHSPQDARAIYELGMAYLNLNRTDTAVRWLEKAQELNPDPEIEAALKALAGPPVKRDPALAPTARNAGSGNVKASRHDNVLTLPARRKDEGATANVVLVVDDSATVRRMIAMILERKGYRVVTAVDGEDGLKKMQEHRIDLVLLDVMMPKLDGYQVCKTIRTNDKTIPIVMLSGKDGFFDRVRGKVAGSTLYMTKPFEPHELLRIVAQYCATEKNAGASS